MNNSDQNRGTRSSSADPKRYIDPLGEHMGSVREAQSKREQKHPNVQDVYTSHYREFVPTENIGERFLGSSDGIVGTELRLDIVEGVLGFFSYDGRCVAVFEDEVLRKALNRGWKIRCVLAYSTFSANEKTIKGTAACFCYDPALDEKTCASIETFISNILSRMMHSSYLKLNIDQEQFIKVIESEGKWYLLKEESWPKLPKGVVYYRKRRTLSDRLIDTANRGNKGCLVASWIGMFVVLIAIGLIVWLIFFR